MTLDAKHRPIIRRRNKQPVLWATWFLLCGLLIAVHTYPIRTETTRAAILIVIGLLWGLTLLLLRPRKWLRYSSLAVTVIIALFLLLPGHADDPDSLRGDYVRSLQTYDGTIYIWGGESHRGIDCSGLVRRGLIDANFKRGLQTANPRLLRESLFIWWHDCSAAQLGEGYRQKTYRLLDAPSLNQLDYTKLLPGDFAVTQGGGHTLAYLGDRTWIEADPSLLVGDRVIRVHVPSHNAWFHIPMHIMRWRQLDG